jgi:hypothetical protein
MPVKAPVFLSVSVTALVLGGMVLSRNLSTLPAVEVLARRARPIASPAVTAVSDQKRLQRSRARALALRNRVSIRLRIGK